MTKEQFISYLRAKIALAGTQQKFAQACGISAAHLSDILSSRRDPSQKLLGALGLERLVMYLPKLDEERISNILKERL